MELKIKRGRLLTQWMILSMLKYLLIPVVTPQSIIPLSLNPAVLSTGVIGVQAAPVQISNVGLIPGLFAPVSKDTFT